VFAKDDGDLYANVFVSTIGITLTDLELVGTGTVKAEMINTGSSYLDEVDWVISMEGDAPLGRFFGGSALMNFIFRGRIFSGGYAGGSTALSIQESEEIESGSVFGIGHVLITVTVEVDGDVVAEAEEDAFLLGGRILLYYPEE
jgi:hypothetical protein